MHMYKSKCVVVCVCVHVVCVRVCVCVCVCGFVPSMKISCAILKARNIYLFNLLIGKRVRISEAINLS